MTGIKLFSLVMAISIILPSQVFADNITDNITISLITCSPGKHIYELEGHTALRIKSTNTDIIVNWGVFDFSSPNFVYRFIKGDTYYTCEAVATSSFVDSYSAEGRTITEQILNLNNEEKIRIISKVQDNLKPQNKVFRYNYLKDNCATRPLNIISSSLPDIIELPQTSEYLAGDDTTFRSIMRIYHKNYPWYQFGIDLALGSGIDYRLNQYDMAFAPDILVHMMDNAKVGSRRLVTKTNILYQGKDVTMPKTSWYLTPFAISIIVLIVIILYTWRDLRYLRVTKWIDAILFSIFGIIGSLIMFLVFISTHEATAPNIIILWLNPLCLCVPLFIWSIKYLRFLICYQIFNITTVVFMLIMQPITGQSFNPAFIPLLICDIMRSLCYVSVNCWNKMFVPKQIHSLSKMICCVSNVFK